LPTYDLLDRLQSASNASTTYGWTYDANGNRLTQTGTTAITLTSSTTSNELKKTTGGLARTYTYDAAGNTKSYAALSFTYDDRGTLAGASNGGTSASYIYDALGQLIEKAGSSSTTVLMYDEQGHLLGEYSSGGTLIQETIWMGDIPVATLRPNGSTGCTTTTVCVFNVHTDQLNAPRKVTKPATGQILWRWDTDPFGTVTPNQNPSGVGSFVYNLRFPGQYYQADTGVFDNHFRHYDPQTGRYIESDPIGLMGGSYSTYAYVGGNPVSFIDPLGLTQCDIDTAKALAMAAQLQTNAGETLQYPDSYVMANLGYTDPGHRRVTGQTLPGVGTRLSNYYLQVLTDRQAAELLDTIIHESVHYTLPIDDPRQDDNAAVGYPYSEAKRLTTKDLVNQLNKKRKDCACGG
jgi:RHS repeat-associated protein